MAFMVPASIAKKAKKPGSRSKISDADLKKYYPEHYSKRVQNRKVAANNANPLYNPLTVLSGNALLKAAQTEAGLQIDPELAAISSENKRIEASTGEQQRRLSGYYGQLSGMFGQGVTNAQTAASGLASTLAASGKNVQDILTQGQQGVQAQSEQDAAIRGTGLDAGTSTRLAAEFADQKARAASQAQGAQTQGGIIAQGWQGLANTAAQVLPGQAALGQQDLARKSLEQQQSGIDRTKALEATRGPLTLEALTKLRSSEFEKQAAIQTLDLKGQAAQADAAKTEFDAAKDAAKLKLDRAKAAETAKHNRAMEAANTSGARLAEQARHDKVMEKIAQQNADKTGKPKKATGVTPFGNKLLPPVQQSTQLSNFDKIAKFAATHKEKGRHKLAGDLTTTADLRKAIGLAPNTPEAVISAALDKAFLGYLSRGTIHKLWRAGISVKGLGVSTKKSPKSSIPLIGQQ